MKGGKLPHSSRNFLKQGQIKTWTKQKDPKQGVRGRPIGAGKQNKLRGACECVKEIEGNKS